MDDDLMTVARLPSEPGRVHLSLTGELDAFTALTLEHAGIDTLPVDTADVVLDLTGLRFIDSGGISCIVKIWRRAHPAGIGLTLVLDHGFVERILRLAGIDGFIPIVITGGSPGREATHAAPAAGRRDPEGSDGSPQAWAGPRPWTNGTALPARDGVPPAEDVAGRRVEDGEPV